MDMDLSPRFASKTVFEGEGGSYKSWSSAEFPLLSQTKVGGGLLVLKPGGFALPHYADSSKVGYVLQGELGIVGMKLPKNSTDEMVLSFRTGDVLPLHFGTVSWWYNNGKSDVVIVFLGDTSKAYVPGEITYFLLTGAQGILGGFSSDFIIKAYSINEKEANMLAKSQTGVLIVKLGPEEGQRLPVPQKNNANIVKSMFNLLPDVQVEKAGIAISFTGANFPFLEEVGLSCKLLKLEPHAMLSPMYNADSSVMVFYVAKGSGKVQIVGINSKLVLDNKLVAGQLFIVPRFFVVSIIANHEGIECFYINTTTRPAAEDFASKQSVFNAFSPSVLQSALNVTPEFAKFLKAKMANTEILIPPMN